MMTKKQAAFMFSKPPRRAGLWWQACEAQGWDFEDREKRLDVFQEAIGQRKSFKELTNPEFGHIRAKMERYANILKGAEKELSPEKCAAPAIRHKILSEILPCLGVYVDDPIAYAERILVKEFKTKVFENLSEIRQPSKTGKQPSSPLERFFWTLSGRLQAKRRKAGDSIKEMREKSALQK